MSNNKRILKEYGDIMKSPPKGCTVRLPNDEDYNIWEATIEGPEDSPYAGGKFLLLITLPKEYPFKPPVIGFKTKVYHPNVSNDERGGMCLGMLRSDEWKPPNKISDVLALVRTVLAAPQPDDSVEPAIADQFKNNRAEFDKTAKDWTKRHANK